jgi:hypothetical protein
MLIYTFQIMQKPKRQQINLLVDDEVLQAIDDIRAMRRPVPTVSEAVRAAILAERDALRRKTEKDRRP